jgi:hypothetical protein
MGKPAPKYWWDFVDNATAIIVQSDYPGGEELARFVCGVGNAELEIAQAERLIADFAAGRKAPNWKRTNVELTGAAPPFGAASSDRSERG